MFKSVLVVGAGGFLGAVARYSVGLVVARFWTRDFPLATLLINVSGSFILGLFATLAAERTALGPESPSGPGGPGGRWERGLRPVRT